MEWTQLREEVTKSAARVADLLREAPSGSTPVSQLSWSVSQLGRHLVTVPRRYQRMIEEPTPFPERLSAVNETEIEAVDEEEPTLLADVLEVETAGLLDLLGDDGYRPVPFFGMTHTVAGLGGVLLGELLLHGLDLARVVGRPWALRADQAIAITRGLLPAMPYSVDREVAESAPGTYHLHLRGGDDWAVQVRNGTASIERGRPNGADLHVSAEPVAFLLLGYGRMSRTRALLRGRMVAWGRKPWRVVPFGKLFIET